MAQGSAFNFFNYLNYFNSFTHNSTMDKKHKEHLVRLTGNKISFDCPMAQYTTWRVGGNSEALFKADNAKELRQVITYLNTESIPYFQIGRGSNLLIKDKGIEGMVILLAGSLATIKQERNDNLTILTGAGLSLADLMTHCRASGLRGLEYFAGIPGTVGGAVAMNAGAFGKEFGDRVVEIHIITPEGGLETRDKEQLSFTYRHFEIDQGAIIIHVRLKMDRESEDVVAGRISDFLKKRKQNQPLDYPSAGSVFKNPQDEYAGRLIENAGLKGKRIGGAMISEKHANFIVNTGGAMAKDILDLICLTQAEVKKLTGIELEPEIKVIGE